MGACSRRRRREICEEIEPQSHPRSLATELTNENLGEVGGLTTRRRAPATAKIGVGGQLYVVSWDVLASLPGSLFADLHELHSTEERSAETLIIRRFCIF